MRYLYRYQKEHFRKITVKRELYERLRKLADEKGVPVTEVIRMLLDAYIGSSDKGSDIEGNIGSNSMSSNIGNDIGSKT